MAKFCPECGHQVAPAAKFCDECGCRLTPSAGGGARPRAQAPGGKQPFPVAEAESGPRIPPAAIYIVVVLLIGAGIFWLVTPKKQTAAPQQAAGAPQSQSQEQLPPGHPDLSALSAPTPRDFTADEKRDVNNLQVLLKTDPKNKDILKRLADINYDADHFDDSIGYYDKYLAIVPDDPAARTDMATMHLYKAYGIADAAEAQKHIQMAIDEYKKVLAKNPGFENAHFNLAQAYLHQLKKDEAVKELQWVAANAKEPGNMDKAKALLKSLKG